MVRIELAVFGAALGAAAIMSALRAGAHDLSRSESQITVDSRQVRVRLAFDVMALTDVDRDHNGRVSYGELDAGIESIFAAVKAHFDVRGPQPPTGVTLEHHALIEDHAVDLDLHYRFDRPVTELTVTSRLDAILRSDHQHVLRATIGNRTEGALLDASNRTVAVTVRQPLGTRILGSVAAVLLLGVLLVVRVVGWRRRRVRTL